MALHIEAKTTMVEKKNHMCTSIITLKHMWKNIPIQK